MYAHRLQLRVLAGDVVVAEHELDQVDEVVVGQVVLVGALHQQAKVLVEGDVEQADVAAGALRNARRGAAVRLAMLLCTTVVLR